MTFGLEWMGRGGSVRVIILTCVWAGVVLPPVLLGLYFGFQKPMEDHWAQLDAQMKAKSLAEHDKLVSMDCKTLGNWLLVDTAYDHDNLIWAQNHYLVSCK